MDHFVDITLLPTPELKPAQILNSIYAKLHDHFSKSETKRIGVSFPKHSRISLGDVLRLHGSKDELHKVIALQWLSTFGDYVTVSVPAIVPDGSKYRVVSRVQVKSSPSRLRRRAMKRHKISESEALSRYPDSIAKETDLPFLQLKSASTKQAFKLFVKHGPVKSEPSAGEFGTYGFSASSTIPWF